MTTFTIDTDNNITAFPTIEEAAAAITDGAESFTSQDELEKLATVWPPERLKETWNSLPGVKPVKGFKRAKAAASRIWDRIQRLVEPVEPKAEGKAKGGAQGAKGAPEKPKATKTPRTRQSAPEGQNNQGQKCSRRQQDGPGRGDASTERRRDPH